MEEDAGRAQNADFRLWMMVYSPVQQAMRLDPRLYDATVLISKDLNLDPTARSTETALSYIANHH